MVEVNDEGDGAVRLIGADDWGRLRHAMSSGAGVVRDRAGLERAARVATEIAAATSGEVRAAATAAGLICAAALERHESRGVHFRSDAPEPSDAWDGRHVALAAP